MPGYVCGFKSLWSAHHAACKKPWPHPNFSVTDESGIHCLTLLDLGVSNIVNGLKIKQQAIEAKNI